MAKADLSFNGLIGVMEAVVETAKHFQEFEDRYRANEASFNQIQHQFQQMQEGAAQLQSLTEERLAALSGLNVELKVRHSQGEQTLAEVRSLVEEMKAQQARLEQGLSTSETRHQLDAERSGQLAQTLGVVEALVEKLQGRQSQLEQSLVAVKTLIRDQDKRQARREDALSEVRSVAEQVADREAQTEKALGVLQSTQQAEKGLITHFEKALNTVRSMVVELEKRHDGIVNSMIEKHRGLEKEVAKLASAAQPRVASAEWMETMESVSTAQGSDLRFIKTLLWITLAAVGLSYALVAYAVILRSS